MQPGISSPRLLQIWRVYLLLAILQGVGALAVLWWSRGNAEVSLLLGLSPGQWIISLFILGISGALGWLLLETWLQSQRSERRIHTLAAFLSRSDAWWFGVLLSGLAFIFGLYLITLRPEVSEPFVAGILSRLLPVFVWTTGLAALTLILLLVMRFGAQLFEIRPRSKLITVLLAAIGILFLSWAWVVRQVYSVEKEVTGWNSLGAPLLDTQIPLAWGAGTALLAVLIIVQIQPQRFSSLRNLKPQTIDLLLCLLLWLGSVALWQSIPISPNWFVSEFRPPNQEFYPNSDALQYDLTSQTALVGEGYWFFGMPYVRRPLLALHHTILHLLGGQDYQTVTSLQVLVLALLSPLIYLLTVSLHNRVSGLIAGVLVVLREANSIAVSGNVTTSHAKLLMADLPSMLVTMGFIYAAIKWLQRIERGEIRALIAGGLLGASMLLRPETFVFFLALAVITSLILFPKKLHLHWLRQNLLLFLGIVLVISPWVYRNWKLSGLIFLDTPGLRPDLIEQRFRPIPTPTQAPIESPAPLLNMALVSKTYPALPPTSTPAPPGTATGEGEIMEDLEKNITGQALDFLKANPVQVASFMIAHYTNSQLQTLLIFPTTFRPLDSLIGFLGHRDGDKLWYECCSAQNFTRRLPYWRKWNGVIPSQAIVPLLINILLIVTGIHEGWKRQKLVGLTPLVLGVTYLLANAMFRNSGGRYILPVDWIAIVYFSIGLAYLTSVLIGAMLKIKVSEEPFVSPTPPAPQSQSGKLLRSPKFYILAAGLFLFGCTIPVTENLFPPIYTPEYNRERLQTLMQSGSLTPEQHTTIQTFLSQGGSVFGGRALYPRFFSADQGEPGTNNPMGPRPYSRVGFYLVGPKIDSILIPTEKRPARFPNASDVIVFACPDHEPLAVAIFNPSGAPQAFIVRSPMPDELSCPIPPLEVQSGDN